MKNKESTLQEKAYALYQYDWLMNHGYTVYEILNLAYSIMNNWHETGFINEGVEADLHSDFEDIGFNGEIYVCFSEFINNEWQDKDYIKTLLNEEDYKEYLHITKQGD